jgi:hypothetical protein
VLGTLFNGTGKPDRMNLEAYDVIALINLPMIER